MIKVVYFDDGSATDYLNIYDGGNAIRTAEDIENQNTELAAKTSAKLFARLSWLPFIGGEAEVSASAGLSSNSSSLLKTTLSNTVLTDFLAKAEADTARIIKFNGFTVSAHKNSIAFLKMFTPYLKMTTSNFTSDGINFDLSKMDEAFERGKGYYEMKATDGKNSYVFRFNIEAFRNNYGIADLTKMDLTYYGIRVGSVAVDLLDIGKEFTFEQGSINSAFDIETQSQPKDSEKEVYDILLAGIDV